MAIVRGQVDRFGNPIPANQAVKVFINADGTVPQQRETVKLDANIVATDDPNTQATNLTVTGVGTVTSVSATSPLVSSGGNAPAISLTNSGTTVGRAGERILVDRATPSASASYTSVTWPAGKYSEMILIFRGKVSAFAFMGFRFNNDSTAANYIDLGVNITSAVVADSADGANGFARTAVDVTGNIKMVDEIHFFPLTDGNERSGWSIGSAMGSVTLASNTKRDTSFGWRDKVTDVTFVTYMLSTAATMTGVIELWGIPA